LRLEEVKEIFEENGEFFFKMFRFRLSAFSDEFTGFQPDVNELFQSQFLSLLKIPFSKDQITRPHAISQLTATDETEKSDCESAEDYFYDILYPETLDIVPQNIIYHLENCRNCAARLMQFAKTLAADLSDEDSDYVRKMTGLLICHFHLLDMDVDCQTAREFLPLLSIPEFEIKIPTPVTAHLDRCMLCTADSARLERLNLNTKQRSTLSRFYTKHIFTESDECPHARPHISAIARLDFKNIPAHILRHVCLCKSCRKLLSTERLNIIEQLNGFERPRDLPCDMIMSPDLFDYSFPFGLDPADDQYAMFRESLTRHLRRCPVCLDKICKLDDTIHNVALRPESGIITRYNLTPSPVTELTDRDRTPEDAMDDYARYGVNVEVSEKHEPPLSDAASLKTPRQTPHPKKLKKFTIPAAAAVILIVVALFSLLTTSPARAIDLSQLYEAVAKIKNVCISGFGLGHGKAKPIQQIWVSQTLNLELLKSAKEVALLDPETRTTTIKDLRTGSIRTVSLAGDRLVKLQNLITRAFGLVPFDEMTDIPEGARWDRVDDKDIQTIVPGTQVYDLTWSRTSGKFIMYSKWRVFVDNQTSLPKRTQWYHKTSIGPDSHEYRLDTLQIITYPTESEIEDVIRSEFND